MAIATELQSVANVTVRLQALLLLARQLKPETSVEPALPTSPILEGVRALHDDFNDTDDQKYRNSSLETAAREILFSSVTSDDIQDPAFVEVWNLLDILIVACDEGMCAPELVCFLMEELLDSQTTHGCRTVFQYLESRRERLARKNFDKKFLSFLRSCNELLRRLSRAEDATFCGRVFFFLFQTFPLGDKSSVNLRGEFHVENTTKFEVPEPRPDQNGDKMEVDSDSSKVGTETPKPGTPQPPTKAGSKAVPIKAPLKKAEEEAMTNSNLYPIFWRLQQDFSDPTRLFAPEHFQEFKKGLANTITKFKSTPTVVQTNAGGSGKHGVKRKRDDDGDSIEMGLNGDNDNHLVDNYNPKYLTSRDLFDLELSDLAFQRHILVQALILIDFLLSLTEKAKKRLSAINPPNKAMLQEFTLSEEDTKWATSTRSTITTYLSGTQEGKLFNRMVETVLARDKNWVRWKVESCPSIVRDPVSTESELEARKGAKEATRVQRASGLLSGGTDFSFLNEHPGDGLEALKRPERYTIPSTDKLLEQIRTDELDLDMETGEAAAHFRNKIMNSRWRIIREVRASRLGLLDKIEPDKKLDAVFRQPTEPELDEPEIDEEVPVKADGITALVVEEIPNDENAHDADVKNADVVVTDVSTIEGTESPAVVEEVL